MRPKLLLLDEPCNKAKEIFGQEFELIYDNSSIPRMIYTQLTPVDIPSLDIPIICPCTGIEHIIAKEIIHLDEEWRSGEGRKITSTAEHTWSLILQLAKLKRMQISGKTIGIVGGMGRIGKQIIQYANAFGMKHIGCDLNAGYKLDIILEDSDIITIHVPLNESTIGMIGKREFDLMKPGALLINTSRAEIVDEKALINWLQKTGKGNYYADDFANRPIFCPNAIQTDHIGGNCIEAREATDIYIANKAVEYWRSKNP